MKLALPLLVFALAMQAPSPAVEASEAPQITLHTTRGEIVIELYPDKAPKTVANILAYVRSGHLNDTIFHRVVPGFVIQGGGFTADMRKKATDAPVENEADNGLLNLRGTLSMARTRSPHSATSQFFINLRDNPSLDHRGTFDQGWGYAVFGKVVSGMEVVDAIAGVTTGYKNGFRDVPVEPVVIEKAEVHGEDEEEAGAAGEESSEEG